jgi:sugar/nucleoside kinase (ribokinase family)
MGRICILGSINMDMVLNVSNMPKTGETIHSTNFAMFPGGKGANQAVAAKRLGSDVYMIGKLGRDDNGAALDKCEIIPAYKVHAIDTTAAGDSFIGALASYLELDREDEFNSIKKAIEFANKVSAIVVQRKGAQPSLPNLEEVLKIYK